MTIAAIKRNAPAEIDETAARAPVSILGVPFDHLTRKQALERIAQMIASRKPHYLATANVDFVVQAQNDLELRRILFDADLVLCDGTPLVWASRWLGNPLPERVAGADLVPELIQAAAGNGHRIFLLGASPEAADRAVTNLRNKFPNLHVTSHSPQFKPLLEMNHDEIIRRIRDAKPDLLFVSFGCPKQEKWIAMHCQTLGVPVTIGVGATIDFIAGHMRRAPRWMQRSGTEWIFRLAQEPRRLFKRYAMDLGIFGFKLLRQLWLFRQNQKISGHNSTPSTLRTNGWQHIELPKHFTRRAVERNRHLMQQVLGETCHCILEMHRVRLLDSTSIACLMRLQRELQTQKRQLILLAPHKAVLAALKFMRLTDFFLIAENITDAHRLNQSRIREESQPVVPTTPLLWQGGITAANAEHIWQTTRQRLVSRNNLTIDLSRVRHIDSSGIALMERLRNTAIQLEREIAFICPSNAVHNVLRHAKREKLLVPITQHPAPSAIHEGAPISQPA
ncbi:MAG TPA: WecB/TagA/CpsF family glycosyltransferase [Candidatus Paceibacterota bacterium]|nr:WecB/TagA/CpsF family glycosyltransferase [Candidatus Paceibacterota bacterium]